jgi:hypothetical protein
MYMQQKRWMGAMMALGLIATATSGVNSASRWSMKGRYVEACTCGVPCGCVISGQAASGCQGVNTFRVDSGRYEDTNLAGAKAAIAHQPGDWAILYFDPGTTEAQRAALQKILEPVFKAYGLKVEAVKTAPIQISGEDGAYHVTIGDVMTLTTETVTGLDKRRAIEYRNMPDPMLRNCYQARAVSGSFKDGGHAFELKGTNSFWSKLNAKGEVGATK